uniref:Renin receptor n=1 Tax=Caenorhabditis tropicalis TaxID=1561998 RepID=A0A1I7TV31_9PELO
MRVLFLIIVFIQAHLAGRLQIILPDGHQFVSENSSFNAKSLLELHKHILGLENSANGAHTVTGGDLFERPRAVIIINIAVSKDFNYDGYSFDFPDNFESNNLLETLRNRFGEKMMYAETNSSGIFGSPHFKRNVPPEIELDSHNQDIVNMGKLAEAIRENDRNSANVIDYYRIHLDVSNARTDQERLQLEKNIKYGIENLKNAINSSTAVFLHTDPVDKKKLMNTIRAKWVVTQPRYHDYPAKFAITAFVCFSILFAIVAMVWFMFDEGDMGKNSLVYRLSTGRQKKD